MQRSFLLLGEGDFTFTRALREYLPNVNLVSSSFDTRSELIEKYRDIEPLLLKWAREKDDKGNINIIHKANKLEELAPLHWKYIARTTLCMIAIATVSEGMSLNHIIRRLYFLPCL